MKTTKRKANQVGLCAGPLAVTGTGGWVVTELSDRSLRRTGELICSDTSKATRGNLERCVGTGTLVGPPR